MSDKVVYVLVGAVDQNFYEEAETTTFNVAGVFSTALRAYRALVTDVAGPVKVSSRENGSLYLRSTDDGELWRIGAEQIDAY
jgi:hypothetical protein